MISYDISSFTNICLNLHFTMFYTQSGKKNVDIKMLFHIVPRLKLSKLTMILFAHLSL